VKHGENEEKDEEIEGNNKLGNILANSSKGFFILILIQFFCCLLGRFINVKDVNEKEVILKTLKNIVVNTQEQCIDTLNSFTKILCFLPLNDKSDINVEVGNEILNLLIDFSKNLFSYGYNKEKCIQFQSKLEECDCFNTKIDYIGKLLQIYCYSK
jgi:hypothetical protein